MNSARRLGAAISAVTVVVLSIGGCALASSAVRSPTASPSPSPSASRPAATELAEPASMLPGTCEDFVAPDAADAAAGADVEFEPSSRVLAADRQSGDLTCTWSHAQGLPTLTLEVRRHANVLAADPLGWWTPQGAPAGVGADVSALTCEDQVGTVNSCKIDARTGDYWLSVSTITAQGVSASSLQDPIRRATTDVVKRLETSPVPASWSPPAGSWPERVDCSAVDSGAHLGDALKVPDLAVQDSTRFGDEFEMSDAVARLGGQSACTWAPTSGEGLSSISASMVAGGGWAVRPVGTDRKVDVPGADSAFLDCTAQGRCALIARIGVNSVIVGERTVSTFDNSPSRETVVAAGTAIISALRRVYS